MEFWGLHGPERFLARIEDAIRAGSNVVLRFPGEIPAGLKHALRARLGEEWQWRDVEVSGGGRPMEVLRRELVPDLPRGAIHSAVGLVRHPNFAGSILWLEGLNHTTWAQWRTFLDGYKDACREAPALERSLFLVQLQGGLALSPPAADVALVHRDWFGAVSEIDMLLYASLRLRDRKIHERQRTLLVACVAKIALWDRDLADQLVNCGPDEILNPKGVLEDLARERAWSKDTPDVWDAGTVNRVDGRDEIHSAKLAIYDPRKILTLRRWSGQASVLLPLIEQRRLDLVSGIRHLLTVPFETPYGRVDDAYDLELSHIAYQLDRASTETRVRHLIRRLRNARNALAHLEPLECSNAMDMKLYVK